MIESTWDQIYGEMSRGSYRLKRKLKENKKSKKRAVIPGTTSCKKSRKMCNYT